MSNAAKCGDREVTIKDIKEAQDNLTATFNLAKKEGHIGPGYKLWQSNMVTSFAQVNKGSQMLHANPEFMACLNREEMTAVVLHEARHTQQSTSTLMGLGGLGQCSLLLMATACTATAAIQLLRGNKHKLRKCLLAAVAAMSAHTFGGKGLAESIKNLELDADHYAARVQRSSQPMINALSKTESFTPAESIWFAEADPEAMRNEARKQMIIGFCLLGAWGRHNTHPTFEVRAEKLKQFERTLRPQASP